MASSGNAFIRNMPWSSMGVSRLAAKVHSVFVKATRQRGLDKYTWMAHQEGRHTGKSGMWFVRALMSPVGARGFFDTVEQLRGVFSSVLSNPPAELDQRSVGVLLLAAQSRLILSITRKGKVPLITCAGAYNAVDLARWAIVWWGCTGRTLPPVIDNANFALVLRGMSKECRAALRAHGIDTGDGAIKCTYVRTLSHASWGGDPFLGPMRMYIHMSMCFLRLRM